MNRSADLLTSQVFPTPDAIDFALPSERSYTPSCKAAPNENLDGCEQGSPRLTPDDELRRVEHWKPAEPQFCKAIAAHYGQSKRNIQKWKFASDPQLVLQGLRQVVPQATVQIFR